MKQNKLNQKINHSLSDSSSIIESDKIKNSKIENAWFWSANAFSACCGCNFEILQSIKLRCPFLVNVWMFSRCVKSCVGGQRFWFLWWPSTTTSAGSRKHNSSSFHQHFQQFSRRKSKRLSLLTNWNLF